MISRSSFIGGFLSALLLSSQALAVSFPSLDPRTFAMGGAGVAAGNRSNAALMNPALMTTDTRDKKASVEIFPMYGQLNLDEKGGMSEIYIYQDNFYEFLFNRDMDIFALLDPLDAANFLDDSLKVRLAIAADARRIANQFLKMSGKVVQAEQYYGAVVSAGTGAVDVSLLIGSRTVSGGLINVSDADISLIASYIDAASSDTLLQTDPFRIDATTFSSDFEMRGAVITEVGLAVSREISVKGHSFALGVTPKFLSITTFDYSADINTAQIQSDLGTQAEAGFNVDVGVAKDYKNGWTTGLVVKDIIPLEYTTVLGNKIKLMPMARAGIARKNEWSTVTVDLDLFQSRAAGFEPKTQRLALGAELNVTESAHMRFGYSANLADSKVSMLTLGAGFSFSFFRADLAIGLNEDTLGLSGQLGAWF